MGGIVVAVVRKEIKNLHVGVYPPSGRVRVAAPLLLDDDAVRLAVVSRLGWIRRQQATFEQQERQSEREMVTGESHFFQGRRYLLDVVEHAGPPSVRLIGHSRMELRIRRGSDRARRKGVLDRWYRSQLRDMAVALLEKWEPTVGVDVADMRIRKMKTRWGSCNAESRRIWLNTELAKKPPNCLEYILVHEMMHLVERHHTERFRIMTDRLLPHWRLYRDQLNEAPLAHEEWGY